MVYELFYIMNTNDCRACRHHDVVNLQVGKQVSYSPSTMAVIHTCTIARFNFVYPHNYKFKLDYIVQAQRLFFVYLHFDTCEDTWSSTAHHT